VNFFDFKKLTLKANPSLLFCLRFQGILLISRSVITYDIHYLSKAVRKTIKKTLLFIMINLRQFTLLEENPLKFVK